MRYAILGAIGVAVFLTGCESLGGITAGTETIEAAEAGITAVATTVNPILGVAVGIGAAAVKGMLTKE